MSTTIGVLGAGQLGRMLALAGYPLGLRFRFFDPDPHSPGGHLAAQSVSNYGDEVALKHFLETVDLITYEFENVPVGAVRMLQSIKRVYPPPQALEVSQDRLAEKCFLRDLGIPTAPFAPIDSETDIEAAFSSIGVPAVLKTRRMGYDGKGQCVVNSLAELRAASEQLGGRGLILEGFVTFAAEFSLIAVRSVSGETRSYPMVQNEHRSGILRRSRTPSSVILPENQNLAENHASAIMNSLEYVGVLAIEYFLSEGNLIANEIAPRVHNSGHWTIEGAETSQFENHLRAVLDLPLGSTCLCGKVGMINIIGEPPDIAEVLRIPGAHLHFYGKSSRPGRKIGHITVVAKDDATLDSALESLAFVK